MTDPSCSSSGISTSRKHTYDVFLSFRGEDTRDNFISHLQDALERNEIVTFVDSKLRRGEEITTALLHTIEVSKVAVIVFSRNYASSTCCLCELEKVIECHETCGKTVIPVFYRVIPADERKQTGSFAEAFAEHEKDVKNFDKVQRWKDALTKASNLAGWDSQVARPDSKLVNEVVKDVLQQLKQISSTGLKTPVEISLQTVQVRTSVSIDFSDVHTLTIKSKDSTGKTTVVKIGSHGNITPNNTVFSRLSTGLSRYSKFATNQILRAIRPSKNKTSWAEEFSLAELANATNNFSPRNKIGEGGYGVVYRGKLQDGREVAIKRSGLLKNSKKFDTQFVSELAILSRLNHRNVVRLVGYCRKRKKRLFVTEYMANQSLFNHLHQLNSNRINSWRIRIKIALDVARGIECLHNYAVPSIVHRDIKSSNILLDAHWTARISDFGISSINHKSEFYENTEIAGTFGYLDPEYLRLAILTEKIDVYGFGVVLLELLTGKRAVFNDHDNGGPTCLLDMALSALINDALSNVLDQRISLPECMEAEAVHLVAHLAMNCVQEESKKRPAMKEVAATLQRALALSERWRLLN